MVPWRTDRRTRGAQSVGTATAPPRFAHVLTERKAECAIRRKVTRCSMTPCVASKRCMRARLWRCTLPSLESELSNEFEYEAVEMKIKVLGPGCSKCRTTIGIIAKGLPGP